MSSSKKYFLYYGNPKKADRRNYYLKLNNFQLFKKNDSNMNTSRNKDLTVACDLSCNINEVNDATNSINKIKTYCKGKSYDIIFDIKKKKAISGKHYSYERYLAKKKGCLINKIRAKNTKYYNHYSINPTFKNKLHNPCSWESANYKANLVYKNMPRDKKNPRIPLPNGPAGAKNCIYNCVF